MDRRDEKHHSKTSFMLPALRDLSFLLEISFSLLLSLSVSSICQPVCLSFVLSLLACPGLVIAFIGDARLAAVILACLVVIVPASAAQAQISQPGGRSSQNLSGRSRHLPPFSRTQSPHATPSSRELSLRVLEREVVQTHAQIHTGTCACKGPGRGLRAHRHVKHVYACMRID